MRQMGRNKAIRKRIIGYEEVIEKHERRIQAELSKSRPDELLVAGWQREIEVWKDTVARLTRRLKREW